MWQIYARACRFYQTHVPHLNGEELALIVSRFRVQNLRKKPAATAEARADCYPVLLREKRGIAFYYGEDQERAARMVLSEEFFTEIASFKMQSPTRLHIEAVEGTELYCIGRADLGLLYRQLPGRNSAEKYENPWPCV